MAGLFLDGPGAPPDDAAPEYRALLLRLYERARGGSRFELTAIAEALEKLGHPERRFPAIHVVGSNGKGSTCAFLASILAAEGLRVGLYTSPHLYAFNERIQHLDARGPHPIREDVLLQIFQRIEVAVPDFGALTFFEIVTVAALLAFAEAQVDVAVIEAGLGARLDATRLVQAEVGVLTDLALEHTQLLGPTLVHIAEEKSAVIRPGKPVVVADGDPAAMAVIDRVATAAAAPMFRLGEQLQVCWRDGAVDLQLQDRTLQGLRLSLLGAHQARNAALAVQAALLFRPTLAEASIRSGLAYTTWPGRLEVIRPPLGPPLLLDGAHNVEGVRILVDALEAHFTGPFHLVFGAMADKDLLGMITHLAPVAASWTLTRPSTARAAAPQELAALVPGLAPKDVVEAPGAALASARGRAARDAGWVVVCGSLYLLGDLYGDVRILRPFRTGC